jgi:nicotinate-nucleotide adenylyltransferase
MAGRAIGVMGGTFDPIHYGHLVAASEVAHRCQLDEVVFVPTGTPWQKAPPSPAEHRYLMTVIATAADPRFTVSRVDVDRPGPTYTSDTLADLRAQLGPGVALHFITGADALRDFPTWRDPERILAQSRLIAVTRPDHAIALDGLPSQAITVVAIPALAISSSDIRERVRHGMPIDYLVPQGVAAYIRKHQLYRDDPA